ncbi:MAG: riboflavin synthase [Candidatus Binatia bacterium]|nr:riboflavin synthase [Candidatus Binatia bacterium]
MFSGIIEALGRVASFERRGGDAVLTVEGGLDPKELVLGESIATNGVCLTVRETTETGFVADLSVETLDRTTLGSLTPGARLNLERSLRVGDRISGHFVFGHVDTVGKIVSFEPEGEGQRLTISFPEDFGRFVADKGSVAIDGISLTVCSPGADRFSIALIPHTLEVTTLGERRAGDPVNLEADMLARYARRAVETAT